MDKKSILSILIVVILCGSAAYNYFTQDHDVVTLEKTDFSVKTQAISNEFSNNSVQAESKYLNKTIEISGKITELNKSDLILDGFVVCSFSNPNDAALKTDTQIKVKGVVAEYDESFNQIKLDQCSIMD